MITDSDGYLELIGYLSDSLSLFEQQPKGCDDAPTLKQFIRYQMVEQMVMLFNEHKSLSQDERLHIVTQVDLVTRDLLEVLDRNLEHKIAQHQQCFIIDFSCLLKNLFDSRLFELTSA